MSEVWNDISKLEMQAAAQERKLFEMLADRIQGLEDANKIKTKRLNDAFDHINSLSRRVDRLLYVVDKLHRGEKVEIGERE